LSADIDKDFDSLLHRLEPQVSTTEEGYERLRLRLVKFFGWKRCYDPDLLADETITRLIEHINAGLVSAGANTGKEIRDDRPYALIYAVANDVFKKHLGELKAPMAESDVAQCSKPDLILLDCRRECLKKVSRDKRQILEAYYSGEQSKEALAEMKGTSLNGLRAQVHRIKVELNRCYKECLERKKQ
jgi:hypothetical protein